MSEEKNSPFEQTSLNLEFVDFENNPKFTGVYQKTVQIGEGEKEFTSHVFTDVETGEDVFISDVYAISKGIRVAREKLPDFDNIDVLFEIEFKGKTEVKGLPFCKFDVGYCTMKQYKDFMSRSRDSDKSEKSQTPKDKK